MSWETEYAVSRLASAADLADDWTHPDIWGVDEIAEVFTVSASI